MPCQQVPAGPSQALTDCSSPSPSVQYLHACHGARAVLGGSKADTTHARSAWGAHGAGRPQPGVDGVQQPFAQRGNSHACTGPILFPGAFNADRECARSAQGAHGAGRPQPGIDGLEQAPRPARSTHRHAMDRKCPRRLQSGQSVTISLKRTAGLLSQIVPCQLGGALTVPAGPSQALTDWSSPSPSAQYSGCAMSRASAGICSNSWCCARYPFRCPPAPAPGGAHHPLKNAYCSAAPGKMTMGFPQPV